MGAGASAATTVEINGVKLSDVKTQIGVTGHKNWLEATEIRDLNEAKKEIKRLRALAKQYLTDPTVTYTDEQPKGRAAVRDNMKIDANVPYEKRAFDKSDDMRKMIAAVMKENILFKNCKKEETKELIDAFEPHDAAKGDVVIKQGDAGEFFYVIESGSIAVSITPPGTDTEMKIGTFGSGTGFGELALMYNTPRAATCAAVDASKLWKLHRNTFRAVMTRFHAVRTEKYAKFVEQVEIGDGKTTKKLGEVLSKTELTKIADALDEEPYKAGAVIVRQGEVGDYFYIIAEGKVQVHVAEIASGRASVIGKPVSTLTEGKSFGEKALLSEDTRKATCVAETDVLCLTLEREDFVAMLGPVGDILSGKASAAEETVTAVARKDEPIVMKDLKTMQTLGQGAFGRVKLVKDTTKNCVYALKCQAKKAIIDNQLQDHVLMEKTILMMLDHPFILKLYASLQDAKYIYFVLELLQGGELFTWLRKMGHFEEADAKFYTAQVVLAFHHMHVKKIAYRDLKPENLVLDGRGYLKVVDLGLAKIVDGKTWTLCGTPDYLAPEIILNEGHDKAVDYWALGVLAFELVAGIPPFYADDPMEVYEKILSSTVQFPSTFPKNLTDLCRKLLKLSASKRLGNGKAGAQAITKHKFYSGFDIEGLLEGSLDSPLKANIKVSNPEDVSNFDKYEDEPDDAEEVDWSPDMS